MPASGAVQRFALSVQTLTGANPQGVGKDVMGTYVHTTFLA
jgi:hypothetical protein